MMLAGAFPRRVLYRAYFILGAFVSVVFAAGFATGWLVLT